jgi:uncharacterized damage-inducible protein DinB
MDIRALFEYNWISRRRFLDALAKLPWKEFVEDRGASFNSMRNIFLHSLEAEQGWLRHLARGRIGEWPSHDYDRDFNSMEVVEDYMDEVEAESRAYLAKLGPRDLGKRFQLGESRINVEDVLMHVVEEEIHHRGELLCLMWQIDREPPYISYIDYIIKTKKAAQGREAKSRRTRSRRQAVASSRA